VESLDKVIPLDSCFNAISWRSVCLTLRCKKKWLVQFFSSRKVINLSINRIMSHSKVELLPGPDVICKELLQEDEYVLYYNEIYADPSDSM
jgi:hypothetical protein